MKKLMTMIAAAATAFGLFAAQTESPTFATSFEAHDAGVGVGAFTPSNGWTWVGEALPLGAYDGDKYEYGEGALARRTSAFEDGVDQNSYLPLKTGTDELTRTVGDVFLDQLVKFTGFEEDPVIGESDGVKIAIWLKATETDGDVAGETNLYITAAKVVDEDQIETTNYLVANPAGEAWAVDKWYRLTVKNIGSIYEENPTDDPRAGFIVYVDGVQVASEDAKGIVYFDSEMTKDAKKYMAAGQLFPAIDTTDVKFNTVGYKGIGAIDDIIVDTQGPEFAQTIECTFMVDTTGVEGIEIDTVKDADGETIDDVEGVYTVPQGTVVTVTYKPAADYKAMGNLEQTQTINADETVIEADETIEVAKIIATVQNGLVSPVPYAETELLGMIENLVDGDVVLFKESGVISGDEDAVLYEFAADTTIGVTIEDDTTTWAINIVGESAFTDNVGVPANFVKVATLDPDYPETCAYAVGEGFEIAGTLQVEGANFSDNIADAITLVGEGKLISQAEGLEGQLEPAGEIDVSENDPEDGWYTYTIKQAPTTGTVIFICEKTAFTNEVANQEATVVIADVAPEASDVEGTTLYTFDGWFKDQACTEAIADMTVVAGETTYIYAKAKDPATLTFTTTIGTAPQAVTVKLGSAWGTAPEMADAENIFDGWAKEGEVVAAEFWTTPVEADDEVAAKWTPAGATAGGVAYATIKAALEAPASSNATVKFLADLAQANAIASVKTSAATIDFNGKNVAITALTYAGDAETFTVENGTLGQWKVKTITVPAGVGLTLDGITTYGQITTKGGDGAALTVKDCVFSNKYDLDGNEAEQTGVAACNYSSYSVSISDKTCKFATAVFTGNEFHPMVRPCIAATGTTNQEMDIFIYGNEFIGDKNCQKATADVLKRYPAAIQLYYAKNCYIENNTFTGEYAQGAFALSSQAGAEAELVVCRGNTFGEDVKYLWVNHDQGTLVTKMFFNDNEWTNEDFTTEKGIYGLPTALESNAPYEYVENAALPEGCDSFYAWLTGENAEKPYNVNGAYTDDISGLQKEDVLIALPTAAVVAPEGLAFLNVGTLANKWTVIEKPTAVTVAVKLGAGVTLVTYGGTTYTEDFEIADVAPSAELTFTEVTDGDQFNEVTTATGDVTGGKVEDAYVYTVAADLTNPNVTITFNTTTACGVVYTIDGDQFAARVNNFTDAQVYATNGAYYVKFFLPYIGSDHLEQLHFWSTTARYDMNDQNVVCTTSDGGCSYATVKDCGKYREYVGYKTLAAAYEAGGAEASYVVLATTDASVITLTKDNLEFTGTFWNGYSGVLGSITGEPVCDETCKPTETWGVNGTTFAFVAEAAVQPAKPGEETEPMDPNSATNTAALLNAQGPAAIALPTEVATLFDGDEGKIAAYKALFQYKVVPAAEGQAKVVLDLTPKAEGEIKADLENAEAEASILNPTEGKATFDAKPGLYYGIAAKGELALDVADVKDWVMAEGATVDVEVPAVEGDKAFFKPACSAAPVK